jgi:hypothetical protein
LKKALVWGSERNFEKFTFGEMRLDSLVKHDVPSNNMQHKIVLRKDQ